jgi:CheY-like chemotaxis protein
VKGSRSNLKGKRAEANSVGTKLNILLIDDSEGIRLLISEILTDAGYEVMAVSNGDSALLAAERQAPDVVITDLAMPGRPVVEVIRVLRQNHARVRIIILSGLMDDLMSQAIMTTGVDAAIDKSMAPEILVDTVKRLLAAEPSLAGAR